MCCLCSSDGLSATKRENEKNLKFNLLSIISAADYPRVLNDTRTSCEFVWNDYPIKRLIHNWNLLKWRETDEAFQLSTLTCCLLIDAQAWSDLLVWLLTWRHTKKKKKKVNAVFRVLDLRSSSSSQHFLYPLPYFGNPWSGVIFVLLHRLRLQAIVICPLVTQSSIIV